MTTATEAAAASFTATQRDLASRASALVMAAWYQTMQDGGEPSITRSLAESWLAKATPYILAARRLSAQRARGYYQIVRRAALPDDAGFDFPDPPDFDIAALTTSLWVTGPQPFVDGKVPIAELFSEERVNAITGAVARHAMNGGRELIEEAVKVDPKVLGWYRTEDSDPCYFCAMLLSRGTVFKEDSFDESDFRFFGPGDAKVHDHCGGSLVPSYTDDPFPADTRHYHERWLSQPKPRPGIDPDDPVEFWRHFYEGRLKP